MTSLETSDPPNPSNSTSIPISSPTLTFSNPDHAFWYHTTAPSLAHLLHTSNYSPSAQQTYLHWHHRFIAPALGPRPIANKTPLFQPCPVYDGSAFEPSINWKERSPSRTVRFTIEATSYTAGTEEDLFNQEATRMLLRALAEEDASVSLKRFELFAERLFIKKEDALELAVRIPSGTPRSQVWMAFDLLRDGGVMAKVYFMPVLKMIQSGVETKTLVFEAARACEEYGSFDQSIRVLEGYFGDFGEGLGPVVEMVAIDCIDQPSSRIKVYLRTSVDTLAKAKKAFSLGGRLKGEEIVEGIKALEELWPILFRIDASEAEEATIFPPGSYCGNAIEMKPGAAFPEVKLHIPVRKIEGTDAQLCESLSKWFARRGHGEFAASYKKELQAAFPEHDLDATNGTHTFVSFAYSKKTGVYMTMYYSPKILGLHVKDDIWAGYDNMWKGRRETSL